MSLQDSFGDAVDVMSMLKIIGINVASFAVWLAVAFSGQPMEALESVELSQGVRTGMLILPYFPLSWLVIRNTLHRWKQQGVIEE